MYTIVSDGAVLAPFQKSDGTWGWYVVEFCMDSREYLNGEEVLVSASSLTQEGLIEPFNEDLIFGEEEEEEWGEEEGE